MRRIIIVTELFYPDKSTTAHILTKIANTLCKRFEVIVISGPPGYDKTQNNINVGQLDNRVNVCRVQSDNFNKNNLIQRGLKFITLSKKLTSLLKREYRDGDCVLICTNPAPLILNISKLKKRLGFNLSILIHDVFPENTIPAGIFSSKNNIVYKFIKNKFDKAYASADKLIVLGRDMETIIANKVANFGNPDIYVITNWADNVEAVEQRAPLDRIIIQYAGNIGRVQGLEHFMALFTKANNPLLSFDLYGSGALLPKIKENTIKNTTANIYYKGTFNKLTQFKVLSECNLSLVTLSDGMFGLGVPSKTYNILQAGKPILYIGDKNSEIALLIRENNIGFVFAPEESSEIINFLSTLSIKSIDELHRMGMRAKNLALSTYSEDKILNKYIELFENN